MKSISLKSKIAAFVGVFVLGGIGAGAALVHGSQVSAVSATQNSNKNDGETKDDVKVAAPQAQDSAADGETADSTNQ